MNFHNKSHNINQDKAISPPELNNDEELRIINITDNKFILICRKGDVEFSNIGRNEWKNTVVKVDTSDHLHEDNLLEIRYEILKMYIYHNNP